jgi:SAM-dependent methyltransferase
MISCSNTAQVVDCCPICRSTELRDQPAPAAWIGHDYFSPLRGMLGIASCRNCSLAFVAPRPADVDLARFYQQPSYDCHSESYGAEDAADAVTRLQLLERHTRQDRLLDFGCGAGALLRAAAARGWPKPVGVELGEIVRNRLNAEGIPVYGALTEAVAAAGPPDAITLIHVLEHLADPLGTLRSFHEVLAPRGVLAVEVPNAASLRALLSDSRANSLFPSPGQRYQAFPIHLSYFNTRSLHRLLSEAGFEVLGTHALGLGVDELLRRPVSDTHPTTAEVPLRSGLETGDPAQPRRFRMLRVGVKNLMSYLRLGEHLFVIARKKDGAVHRGD